MFENNNMKFAFNHEMKDLFYYHFYRHWYNWFERMQYKILLIPNGLFNTQTASMCDFR